MTATRKEARPAGNMPARVGTPLSSTVRAEDRLLKHGLLPGIDFCRHALQLSTQGQVPDAAHLLGCPVCLRRWRATEAGIQDWRQMDHDEAIDVLPEMAERFGSPERDERYRPFYAHVATCPDCERRLAELTFDASLPPSDR